MHTLYILSYCNRNNLNRMKVLPFQLIGCNSSFTQDHHFTFSYDRHILQHHTLDSVSRFLGYLIKCTNHAVTAPHKNKMHTKFPFKLTWN